jgi:hypothetical protein
MFRVSLFVCLLAGTWMIAKAQDSSSQSPAPDNTKVNQRDKNQAERTADQQKENRSDREMARQIRRSIVQDKTLSSYAHNVKIIAETDGHTQRASAFGRRESCDRNQGCRHCWQRQGQQSTRS